MSVIKTESEKEKECFTDFFYDVDVCSQVGFYQVPLTTRRDSCRDVSALMGICVKR